MPSSCQHTTARRCRGRGRRIVREETLSNGFLVRMVANERRTPVSYDVYCFQRNQQRARHVRSTPNRKGADDWFERFVSQVTARNGDA